MIKIAPSILAADFARLGEEIKMVEKAGADYIHVDVMDGMFVPNITIGQPVVRAIRKITSFPLDVHLMINEPDRYIESFADAGADLICIHQEACIHLDRAIDRIRELGKKPAVSLNPSTDEKTLRYVLHKLDMVLVMSVNPGFGGQSFIESSIEKISSIKLFIYIPVIKKVLFFIKRVGKLNFISELSLNSFKVLNPTTISKSV